MYIENNITRNQISKWLFFMFCLIAFMIIVGGLTRLTDSGLSITEWELFSGIFPPMNDQQWLMYFESYKKIPEFKLQNFSMTLSEFKVIFWWEWAHRFLGRLIGISFLLPLIYFTFKENFKNLINFYVIFLLICFQGFIGWYMVSSGLVNKVDVSHFRLSIHLLIAFIILSLLFWNYLNLNLIITSNDKIKNFLPLTFLILIFLQIIIGAFVSGMDAGKIYNSWPLMNEKYFPDDSNINDLFKLSVFSDPSLVQFIHRNLAYVICFIYIYIIFHVYKKKAVFLYKPLKILGFFILLQIILGIITIILGAQIFIASMHQISSIFLVCSSIYFFYINNKTN